MVVSESVTLPFSGGCNPPQSTTRERRNSKIFHAGVDIHTLLLTVLTFLADAGLSATVYTMS